MYALIMAGGSGSRLWPLSTKAKPKQYLDLVSDQSLLAQALGRFDGLVAIDRRFVVTVSSQEALARRCAEGFVGGDNFIFEPAARNTGPCLLLSLVHLLCRGADKGDVVAVVPADHMICNGRGFRRTMAAAADYARRSKIVVVGINPTFPHTGYGYIRRAGRLEGQCFGIEEFVEKPDFATAKGYLAEGCYLWNAGIFVATIGTFVRQFELHAPDMYALFEDMRCSILDGGDLADIYGQMPGESFDYAVMEKSKEALVVAAGFDWNDLGTWRALEEAVVATDGNTLVRGRESRFIRSKGNVVFAPRQSVFLVDTSDMVVVSDERVLMVLPKGDSQKVKEITALLEDDGSLKHLL